MITPPRRYRRGDFDPTGRLRFWSYVRGAEGWLTHEKFAEAMERDRFWRALASASPDSLRLERKKHRKKTNKK